MSIYEDNGNKGYTGYIQTDLFWIAAQATGVLEASIKGTTSSFMTKNNSRSH